MAGNPLSQYGYPSMAQMQGQARGLASAAVPTIRSINAQYGRQQSNVTGFTNALVSALRGDQGAVGQGYNQAIAQQGALDAAAQHALGALGSQYAGAAVANQGIGNSASSRLISQGAAARNYSSQLPGVGAAQGALAHMTLNQGQNQAIQQRNDAFRSALSQAMQQVQSNALARAQAAADISQNNKKLLQAQEQINNQANQFQQSLGEQQREFNAKLAAAQVAAGAKKDAAATPIPGMTPNEVNVKIGEASTEMVALLSGTSPPSYDKMIATAIGHGVDPRIAQIAANRLYAMAARNPFAFFPTRHAAALEFDKANNIPPGALDSHPKERALFQQQYNAALAQYQEVLRWFQEKHGGGQPKQQGGGAGKKR